jgi:molybdenum cofactor guanylyltransferase
MAVPEVVVGVLLAGGRSSRMGGGDKCLLPMAGRPMLAYVIERLGPQVSDLIINANGDLSRFSGFGLPIVADQLGGHAGPLAGVHAGIVWARANRLESRFVITAAADTPFFPADLVSRSATVIPACWSLGRRRACIKFSGSGPSRSHRLSSNRSKAACARSGTL